MLDATPLARAYARRRMSRLGRLDPAAAQEAVLRGLLARAKDARFGRAHGFAEIRGVAEYQARVKLRRWEDFWREWWQEPFPRLEDASWPGLIPYFAETSGTTGGTTKRIPVSREMVRANRRAAFEVLTFHLAARPESRVLKGRNFLLGGSTALKRLAPGVSTGDLSGIAAAEIPFWARRRIFPQARLALVEDWERKIAALAPASLAAGVTSISGTPSWMLLFFAELGKLQPGARLGEIYPGLELVVHGGVGFEPYRAAFAEWLAGSRAETREVYPASEGFIAAADRGEGEGLRMLLDNGIFYEFVHPDAIGEPAPERRWIEDAEIGVEYALVLSTNAGLWSYVLGDTVRLTERAPPRLKVTGRVGWSLSVAGEHLIGEEIEAGVAEAAAAVGGKVADYAAAALAPDEADARSGHLFIVELAGAAGDVREQLAAALDVALARANDDYAAHRKGGFGLRPPAVLLVRPGTFAAWMRSRGKFGGQNKVPRVIGDAALLERLLRYLEETGARTDGAFGSKR
ncbi:MAG: GH3 auxin-responsive promoter family protein [Rhodospirillales bacterium]|nr:GH3 auxin-responsive promoter family protein [Rhodospirillales bacterium]